jgi:O-antigen/teichoic acid export membrane protein
MTTAEMSVPQNEIPGDSEPHWLESRMEAIVLGRLGHSASRAFWMLGDQGVVSLGNMCTTWVLGKYLPFDWQFGAYGILMETMFFLNSLQAALVNYPLTIQGASGNRRGLRRSATAALLFTFAMLPLLGLGMGIGAVRAGHANSQVGAHSAEFALALTAAGAMFIWQMQETLRRALISEFRIAACIPGDFISYGVQAMVVYALHRLNLLSLTTAFIAIGASSLAGMILQAFQIGLAPIKLPDIFHLAADWWRLGKWALLTNLSTFVTGISFWWVMEFRHKPDVTAFTAINLPIKLTTPVLTSIGGLIIPAVARAASQNNWKQTRRSALRYAALGGIVLGPIFAVIASVPGPCLHLLYGTRFSETAPLLRLWVINCVVAYVALILNSWLAGLKEPRYQFLAQMVHMAAVVTISLPATAIWGIKGLILGGLCSTLFDTIALFYFLHQADRHLSSSPLPPLAQEVTPPQGFDVIPVKE